MANPKPSRRIPRYCLHKPSGQARIIIKGRHHYLGPYGSTESWEKYHRLLAEQTGAPVSASPPTADHPLTIAELIDKYWDHVLQHYVKDGQLTGEHNNIRAALRPVLNLYGDMPAAEFGPKALKAARQAMIEADISRSVINSNAGKIRRMFRWAASEELVSASVWQALSTVQGLQRGRTAARETDPVLPVSDAAVDATLAYMPPIVADMVRFHRLTGCRPGEVCILRPCDIDRRSEIWIYRPASHKTEHRGRERVILIGPKAQAILRRYLLRAADAFCFSPEESEARRKAEMRAKRKSKVQPSQIDRSKRNPSRKPASRYTSHSYARAICRACRKADLKAHSENREVPVVRMIVPIWHPNQLRHAAATRIRREFGLEAAQVVLGHSKADVTQVYAERDIAKAADVMRQVG